MLQDKLPVYLRMKQFISALSYSLRNPLHWVSDFITKRMARIIPAMQITRPQPAEEKQIQRLH